MREIFRTVDESITGYIDLQEDGEYIFGEFVFDHASVLTFAKCIVPDNDLIAHNLAKRVCSILGNTPTIQISGTKYNPAYQLWDTSQRIEDRLVLATIQLMNRYAKNIIDYYTEHYDQEPSV